MRETLGCCHLKFPLPPTISRNSRAATVFPTSSQKETYKHLAILEIPFSTSFTPPTKRPKEKKKIILDFIVTFLSLKEIRGDVTYYAAKRIQAV